MLPPETARPRPRQRRRDARVQGRRRALLGRPGRGTRCGWCGPCRAPRPGERALPVAAGPEFDSTWAHDRRADPLSRCNGGVTAVWCVPMPVTPSTGGRLPWSSPLLGKRGSGSGQAGVPARLAGTLSCPCPTRTPDQPRRGACLIPQTAGRTSGRSPARPARSGPARRPAPGGSHTAGS
jgi:hypothetical protein